MSRVHVYGALFYLSLSLRVRTEDPLIYEEPEKFYWLGKGIRRIDVNEFGDGFLLDFNFEAMLGRKCRTRAMEIRYYYPGERFLCVDRVKRPTPDRGLSGLNFLQR